ncbi:hypothetical protein TWF730_009279 [Orbilia blumenaviensis]|uniref:Tail specific protease domain-containing protein n=1 Tax=Orbilia blumenaviensis TaxID=1796055 RepID=A0AAV9V1T8_9PEZI
MHVRAAFQLLSAASIVAAINIPPLAAFGQAATTTAVPIQNFYSAPPNSSASGSTYAPGVTVNRATGPATGTVTAPRTLTYTQTDYTPNPSVFRTACAEISSSYASRLSVYASQVATDADAIYPTRVAVRPREAWDCLYSIPLNVDVTLEFISGVAKYLQFQSTIEYLKNPPANSLQDPVDIIGGLEKLAEQVRSGAIAHHIRFENAFRKLLQRCHDGHLGFNFNSGSLINFRGPFSLISVSPDAIEKPKVYVEDDLFSLDGGDEISYVTRIDGYDVEAWLAEWADYGSSQSPDARYNAIFANRDPGSDGTFYTLYGWYPGKNSIAITFSNSSTYEYEYRAFARWNSALNWTGIRTGADFYDQIVLNPAYFETSSSQEGAAPAPAPEPTGSGSIYHAHDAPKIKKRQMRTGVATTTTSTRASATSTPRTPRLVYFNAPFMRHRVGPYVQDLNGIIGGYFLNDTVKTAVLDVSSFAAADDDAEYELLGFQAALAAFFAEARRVGSQKLILDVRGNGGGLIALGFELYKQLFPAAPANSYYRIRAHEAAQIFAIAAEEIATDKATEEFIETVRRVGLNNIEDEPLAVALAINSGFNRQNTLDIRGNTPANLDTFIGPYNITGLVNDTVSLLVQTNYNFPLQDNDISGFGSRANFSETPQPFRKEDILLLSDGTCASTCTIFSELLKREQANVSTVVMGGRPNDGPSAHVGGTHGSRVLTYANLLSNSRRVVNLFPPETDEQEQYLIDNIPLALPFGFTYAAINFRDAIRPEDETATPLQFALEPADCRLYFSPIGFTDSIYLWGELSKLKWGTGSAFEGCAVGGLQRGEESTGPVPDDPDTVEIVNYILRPLSVPA